MKRRKKKPENETEATGKVGQQKPVVDELHPGPIVPTYGSEPQETVAETAPADERRMETEVQPESTSTPPPEQKPVQSGRRQPRSQRRCGAGHWPSGSGKTTWFKRRASRRSPVTCCGQSFLTIYRTALPGPGLFHPTVLVACSPDRPDAVELR